MNGTAVYRKLHYVNFHDSCAFCSQLYAYIVHRRTLSHYTHNTNRIYTKTSKELSLTTNRVIFAFKTSTASFVLMVSTVAASAYRYQHPVISLTFHRMIKTTKRKWVKYIYPSLT